MFLVIGASGNSGSQVVDVLRRRNLAFQIAARRATETGSLPFDFYDRATWSGALSGKKGVYLLRPPAIADMAQTLLPFVDAIRDAGAGPIVFLSVAGAERNPILPHAKVEKRLFAHGASDFTILRPGYFAQNLEDAFLADIRDEGRITLPAGDGRVAFVDLRDVAEVAVDALCSPAVLAGKAVTLTGPRAIGFDEVATLISAAAGRPVRYDRVSPLQYWGYLRRKGQPVMQALVQTILNTGLRFGNAEKVDLTLPRLLGRPATDIATYISDNRAMWRADASLSAGRTPTP